ncbi:MAG TPA: alkaline phosphatase family protein [Terriglobales bacterium]|nr:alkaline phosphatase family protein [Terriglobales bacterium]
MRRRLVVLLVDALGWELAARTPGFACVLPHRRRLETILGFSSGALPTLFTGRLPEEHGRWLMYRRARGGDTPFRGFRWLGLLPPRVRRSWRLSVLLTRLVARRGVRGYFSLYDVPRPLLERFDLAERDDVFAPGGLPGGSLWDAPARLGIPWRSWNWRTPEPESLAAVERRLAEGSENFLFCYTAELDALLHEEGSAGTGTRERLAVYDAWLGRVVRGGEERGEELRVVLLSDHGMVDIRRVVDVMGAVAACRCRWPRDFLPFFDSSLARFWWRGTAARDEVRAVLAATGWGRWLGSEDLARAGALFPDREYGEDIFLLDPGLLMVPSFMGARELAAMHGYDPAHADMAALLCSNRPIPPEVRRLADVRAFLEAELAAVAS